MILVKISKSNKIYLCLLISLFCFNVILPSLATPLGNNKPDTKLDISPNTTSLEIESDTDPLEDGSYKVGSVLTFSVKDHSYGEVVIKISGSTRSWSLDLELSAGTWGLEWDTSEPTSGEEPVPGDTYSLALEIDGKEEDCSPDSIVISEEADNTMIIVIILIVCIAAGIGAGGLFIFKKKRSKTSEDLEFSKVDKASSKKRGEVFKGASSIGRRSGQIAETKTKKVTAGPSVLPPVKDVKQGQENLKKPKQMMPVDSTFKFETNVATSTAIVKDMELKMDLDQKISFLTSKVDSTIQNVDIFKAILQQHDQEELVCPKCGKRGSRFWIACPYCEISEHDSELGLKQSVLGLQDVRFCPKCNRIIKPSWIECPYCFVR